MKTAWLLFGLALLVGMVRGGEPGGSVGALWDEVEKAISDGLPKTAIEVLDKILAKTAGPAYLGPRLRALTLRIVLEAQVEGNRPEEKVARLKARVEGSAPEVRPVLRLILAQWYWHYFDRNRWRFMQRTATEGVSDSDFTTWDLPRLFREIDGLLQSVLDEKDLLRRTPVSHLAGFLEKGTMDEGLRPTLYDVAAYLALDFYTLAEQPGTKAEDEFEVDASSAALGTRDEFLGYNPSTGDVGSPKLKAVHIYQELLRFHGSGGSREALVDADRLRLRTMRNLAFGEGASDVYTRRLESLSAEAEGLAIQSMVRADLAEEWVKNGDRAAAHRIAKGGETSHPGTVGARRCANLIDQIQAKELSVQAERCVPPAASRVRLSYRNVEKVYFRVVPDKWDAFMSREYAYPNQLDDKGVTGLLRSAPKAEWAVDLTPTRDFNAAVRDVDVPALPPGYYRVFVSWKPDFLNSEEVQHTWAWVSRFAMVVRNGPGFLGGLVLDTVTGAPLAGVSVNKVYRKDRFFRHGTPVVTDANGYFSIPYDENQYDVHLYARKGGEELFDTNALYTRSGFVDAPSEHAVFFTDRAIYRPGQTVHFKGICLRADRDGNSYAVIPGRAVEVLFRDANAQLVEKLTLTTNAFGSFSGTVTAPADRLTGAMSLWCGSPSGQASFRVEEYKRPKFKVDVEQPKDAFRLGGEVEVAGRAMAYTGAAVDGAEVRYRVVREARFPEWLWWYFRAPQTSRKEIAHGKLRTDAEGRFRVSFDAKPDQSVSADTDPDFVFTVFADVTDSTGETRSGSARVALGFKALRLRLSADAAPETGRPFTLTVFAENLSGQPQAAQGKVTVHRLLQPDQPVRDPLPGQEEPPVRSREGKEFSSRWQAWPAGDVADERRFQTTAQVPDPLSLKLSAGLYRVEAVSIDAYGKEVKALLPLMVQPEAESARFPIRLPSVAVLKTPVVNPGEDLHAVWGTGYDQGRSFVEVFRDEKVLARFWTSPGATQQSIRYRVLESHRGGLLVKVTQVRENRGYFHDLSVAVPWANKELELSFDTFRDKTEPGATETVKVKVRGRQADLRAAEMVAALYDQSLDQFAPLYWQGFHFFRSNRQSTSSQFSNAVEHFQRWRDGWNQFRGVGAVTYASLPESVTRNYSFYEAVDSFGVGGGGRGGPPVPNAPAPMAMAVARASQPGAVGGLALMEKEESTAMAKSKKDALADVSTPVEPAQTDQSMDGVQARRNLNETAFFLPHLLMDRDGTVSIQFTMPEALTTWKFMGFAHGKGCESGMVSRSMVTQKSLMVQPNPPRFLREGDRLLFTAKVTNLSGSPLKGRARIAFKDMLTGLPADDRMGLAAPEQGFEVPAGESRGLEWEIRVPVGLPPVTYTVKARADAFSDGEEGGLPVLSSRVFVAESIPLSIRGPAVKRFTFKRMEEIGRPGSTLDPVRLTVQMASNPAWYAIQALPYLMEFPHECSEQVFNRLYANSIAGHVAASNPKVRQVFDQWRGTDALKSNLEKSQDLKSALLSETPWVLEAQGESAAKRNVGLLFEANTLDANLRGARSKLKNMQLHNGAWPWFPGGRPDPFITLYLVTGFGKLRNLGVQGDASLAVKALPYVDDWFRRYYDEITDRESNHLSPLVVYYLYGRSFFLKDRPVDGRVAPAVEFFRKQGAAYWLKLDSRMNQAQLAVALNRLGDAETARKIVASIKERSVSDEEMGMFWREGELSCWWYRAPIETQAAAIEAFDEVAGDLKSIEDCKVWLLKQKQTQGWKTTKATADAVYALILRGADLLSSTELVDVSLGGTPVKPEKVEAGTGFYEKRYAGSAIRSEFSEITVSRKGPGVAWGGVHFQYFEDMSKVTPHATGLSLEKRLFVSRDTPRGPVIEPVAGPVKVGDLLKVRVVLRADRDMEYVHLKDMRGSGTEPVNVLSGYRYQDGLAYYESTKDTASHFFIDYLPKGTYVFEYALRVQLRGRYQTGMAEVQCMYAPEFSGHSESLWLDVE